MSKNNTKGIAGLLILLFLFVFGTDFLPGLIGSIVARGVLQFIMFIFLLPFLVLIVALIAKSKKRKLGEKNKTNVHTTEELIETLKEFSTNANEIYIDDETYLLLTDPNNINLENVDIFMRNEYIGNLGDYFRNFPSSYNSLANKIDSFVRFTTKNKKNSKKNKVEQVVQQAIPSVSLDKNCAYFIDRFNQLNNMIQNESVSGYIDETVNYLKQIKKIEDEYPDSKKKTTKLYEYYLPMYAEILANYDRLATSASNSNEFKENENKLMKTSVLINSALKTISSTLAEDYYTEMNVNMKTLESVLKKDGYVNDMTMGKENSND